MTPAVFEVGIRCLLGSGMRRRTGGAFSGNFGSPPVPLPYALQSAQLEEPPSKFRTHYVVQYWIDRRVYVKHDPGEVKDVVVIFEADFEAGAGRSYDYP